MSERSNERFKRCLQAMQEKCVIRDSEYWDVKWREGETPIPSECDDNILSLMTKEGFNIILELRDDEFGDRKHAFYAYVKPPHDFNHDLFDSREIIYEQGTLCLHEGGIYGWTYRSWFDAKLSQPLESQHRDCFVSGPVQIMETCRAFIGKVIENKHKSPYETFQKNLKWMKENGRCAIRDPEFWDVKLGKGETPFYPPWSQRPLCIRTKDDFEIRIKLSKPGFPRYLIGSIQLPPHFMLTSWLRENAKYESLSIYVPQLHIDVHHTEGDAYEWRHDNYAYDADLSLPLSTQSTPGTNGVLKRVSGPVQMLEEARNIIHAVKHKESMLKMRMKHEEMERIRKDLMEETCHPRRVERWTEQGFDPFEEEMV